MNTFKRKKKSRCSPIPLHVSDYIIKEVLKNEKVLIQGGGTRMLVLNEERKQLWHQISVKVFMKFKVSLTPSQIQVHFNNRKKRVLAVNPLEKGFVICLLFVCNPYVNFQVQNLCRKTQKTLIYVTRTLGP